MYHREDTGVWSIGPKSIYIATLSASIGKHHARKEIVPISFGSISNRSSHGTQGTPHGHGSPHMAMPQAMRRSTGWPHSALQCSSYAYQRCKGAPTASALLHGLPRMFEQESLFAIICACSSKHVGIIWASNSFHRIKQDVIPNRSFSNAFRLH